MSIDKQFGLNPAASKRIFEELNKPLDETKEIPIIKAANKIFEKNQKTFQELEKYKNESLVDSLTGCYNRNYFEKFKNENFNSLRDHNYIGLVFVDLNGLKKVNDNLGHKAGDTLIKNTATFLKTNFRKEDVVVRLGGDEFVVICYNHQNDNNFEEGLTSKIRERRDLKANDPENPISFAFGVAVYDQARDFNHIENTINLADQRMYTDKAEVKTKKVN